MNIRVCKLYVYPFRNISGWVIRCAN